MATLDDVISALHQLSSKIDLLVAVSRNAEKIQLYNTTISDTSRETTIPLMYVPDGMSLVIEAPVTNGGIIIISSRDSQQHTKQLSAGQNASYRVTNTDNIVIMGDTVGDIVLLTSEKKGG